ncbi:MAG: DDE-type integrase/transposase/recombinase [Salinivirgaceae bacterium]|jgi:transposase InsO family protein
MDSQLGDYESIPTKVNFIYLTLCDAFENMFTQYAPTYLLWGYNISKATTLAKNHALLVSCFNQKEIGTSLKELFEYYKTFHPLYFNPKNLDYFYQIFSKIKSVEDIPAVLVNKNKGRRGNRSILTELHKSILKEYLRDPTKLSYVFIQKAANQQFLNFGIKELSYASVKRYLGRKDVQNECRKYRYGIENLKNTLLPYLKRAQPQHVGDLWQIDGTRLNVFYRENGKPEFIDIVVIIDVRTMKVLGFSLGENENADMIIKAFHMAIVKTQYLPFEIQSDNAKSFTKKEFVDLKREFYLKGCNWRFCSPYNPRDKGHLERFFRTFNTSILKSKPFYLGDGIQSKDINGKPSKELVELMFKSKEMLTRNELEANIADYIEEYNNMEINGKLAPNVRFASEKPENIFKLKEADIAFMFLSRTEIQIDKSTIIIQVDGIQFSYSLEEYDHIMNFGHKTKVIVKFDPKDLSHIFIFDIKTEEFIGKIEKPIEIKGTKASATKEDYKKIQQFSSRMDEIHERIENCRENDLKVIDNAISKLQFPQILPTINSKEEIKLAKDNFFQTMAESINRTNSVSKKLKRNNCLPKKDITPNDNRRNKLFKPKPTFKLINPKKDE